MTKPKTAVVLFAATSVLSFIAAMIPLLKGGDMNVVFLGVGVVFLVIAVANAKKARATSDVPPAQ